MTIPHDDSLADVNHDAPIDRKVTATYTDSLIYDPSLYVSKELPFRGQS